MAGKDIVIRAAIEGAGEVAKSLKSLQGQLDQLAIEGAKTGDPFKSIPDTVKKATPPIQEFNKQLGLSRQQALALTYTFNDVTASIASGISPMTILLQQGGQLTQAFGGIGGTVKALLPQLLKWAPAIAAAAGAAGLVVGTLNVLSKGAEAAKKMNDLADASERARVSQETLNKISAGLIAKGVPADQAGKLAEESVKGLRNMLLSAKDAQVELNKSRKEFAKSVQPPGTGENPFAQIEQTGKFLKTVRPPVDGEKIGQSVSKYASLKDIISRSGQDVSKLTGKEEDLLKIIDMLALAYRRAGDESKKFALETDLLKQLPQKTVEIIKSGGTSFLNAEDAKARALGPRPSTSDARAGQEAFIAEQQNLAAEQNKQLVLDARLISSSKDRSDARRADIAAEANDVGLLNQGYQKLNEQINNYYNVKSGNKQAREDNPGIANVVDLSNQVGSALSSVASQVQSFTQSVASSIESLLNSLRSAQLGTEAGNIIGTRQQQTQNTTGGTFASGGFVSGPGTSTSDSIPAMLSAGEFVVRAAAVRRYGVGLMHAINGMSKPRGFGFADGGLVPPVASSMGGGSANNRGLTLVLDGKSFGGLSGSGSAMDALERYAISRRMSSTTKRTSSRVG